MQLLINIDENRYKVLQEMQECGLGYYNEVILAGIPFKWNYIAEGKWPKAEDENKQFLVLDSSGKVSIETFYLTVDEPHQPFFSGTTRNTIAWLPLPSNA